MRKCPNCKAHVHYSHLMFTDRYLCECPECKKENHLDDFEEIEYRVLTLWQPWASLLVYGVKKIETRPAPTSWTAEKGGYLIHAASKWTFELAKICMTEPFKSELRKLGYYVRFYAGKSKIVTNLPLGQIIGAIEVDQCCRIYNYKGANISIYYKVPDLFEKAIVEKVYQPEVSFGDYRHGRFAWLCQNPRLLKTPIPYKGGQGYYQRFKGDVSQLEFI